LNRLGFYGIALRGCGPTEKRFRFRRAPPTNRSRSCLDAPSNLARMAACRHVTKKILAALLALEALVTAGCAGSQPRHPSSLTSPAAPPVTTNPAAEPGSAALVEEVQRELKAMRVTRYQHTTSVDESSGSYFYDCSGLLDYALGRSRPADLKPIPRTHARPLAGDIEGYLHGGLTNPMEGWQALARVDALGPGDVVAWQATEDSTTGDTGHVMVVLEAPTLNSARAAEWLVRVADSTLSPHALDSRHPGTTGLGTGTIGLLVDERGAPIAFYWRGGVSPQAKPTQIALGRPR